MKSRFGRSWKPSIWNYLELPGCTTHSDAKTELEDALAQSQFWILWPFEFLHARNWPKLVYRHELRCLTALKRNTPVCGCKSTKLGHVNWFIGA